MPIYEFSCLKCGKEFERLVFASDAGAVKCPSCGSEETRKEFSVFACSGIEKSLSGSCGSASSGGFS
ncbi:MAG: zinc ribbon domain-containing protein [Deltaproteobacteria bacterium]|nr:zinc ribbon domain-containing protein [Deltaproteobacteria bacterium]